MFSVLPRESYAIHMVKGEYSVLGHHLFPKHTLSSCDWEPWTPSRTLSPYTVTLSMQCISPKRQETSSGHNGFLPHPKGQNRCFPEKADVMAFLSCLPASSQVDV